MGFYRFAVVVIVFTIIGLTSSCAKSKYLMPGLKLPSGSTVVDEMDESDFAGMPMPTQYKSKRSKTVFFNCSGGWSKVKGHFNSFMTGKGYENSFDKIQNSISGMSIPNMDFSNMMLSYEKDGGKYTVLVTNYSAISGMADMVGGGGTSDIGDFALIVMEVE